MTTYKNIHGKRVKTFATDLGNDQAEGQIFYSSTDNQFKAAVSSAAWSSSGPLGTARYKLASAPGAPATAGIVFSGQKAGSGSQIPLT